MILDRYTSRIVEPTAEPISLAQAKRQLRVDGTDDDTYISGLISAARNYVENQCSVSLVVSTFKQTLDCFPAGDTISLNFPPLLDVTSITYVDSAGATQTLATTVYSVVTHERPGKVKLKYLQDWPTTRIQPDAVTITFRAGYVRPFTANASTDALTLGSSEPADLTDVFLSTTDGDLPAPLAINTAYDTNGFPGLTCTIRLANDASDANITDTGTGTHFIGVIPPAAIHAMLLLISMWYTTRNSEMETNGKYPGIDYLLAPICWGGTYV